MATPFATMMRTARPVFRQQQQVFTRGIAKSGGSGTGFTFKQGGRRWASSEAAPVTPAQVGWVKRMWDSPIGLKTVHFWAPVMKWCIVIAGISDMYRPAENLSLTQNAALTATGLIWTRWCFVIRPRNILLATVNFFLGVVGVIQVTRILNYNYNHKGETAVEQIKESVVESTEGLKKTVKG